MKTSSTNKQMVTAVSGRLARDVQERYTEFYRLTGIDHAKIVNECLRIGLPILEERRISNQPILPGHLECLEFGEEQ